MAFTVAMVILTWAVIILGGLVVLAHIFDDALPGTSTPEQRSGVRWVAGVSTVLGISLTVGLTCGWAHVPGVFAGLSLGCGLERMEGP